MSQGGLAPVGVMLAKRNPSRVSHLVLTSPPTWKDMTTAIPPSELEFNYRFLSSPLVGPLAFGLLETKWAVEFFSNAFLFANQCDDEWLNRACNNDDDNDARNNNRPPVMAFNAGLCNHRSFQEELTTLPQPTLVLSGDTDRRQEQRVEYANQMMDCRLETLPGQNVLPWESPQDVAKALEAFLLPTSSSP